MLLSHTIGDAETKPPRGRRGKPKARFWLIWGLRRREWGRHHFVRGRHHSARGRHHLARGLPPFDAGAPPFRLGAPPFGAGAPPFGPGAPPFRPGSPPFRAGSTPFGMGAAFCCAKTATFSVGTVTRGSTAPPFPERNAKWPGTTPQPQSMGCLTMTRPINLRPNRKENA